MASNDYYAFTSRIKTESVLQALTGNRNFQMSKEDRERLDRCYRNYNFYDGYHWEEIGASERDEVTKNYCRAFVNKFVAFELGKGFSIKMKPDLEPLILPFVNEVWEDNNKEDFCQLFGQSKSVTGDSWVHVQFIPKYDAEGNLIPEFYDPYDEYDKGRISISVIPTGFAFPRYNKLNVNVLEEFTLVYPIQGSNEFDIKYYIQKWTRTNVTIIDESEKTTVTVDNPYDLIPFFQCKNYPEVGRTSGISDLEDVIPLNVELNIKSSDVSEIIDYHASPITVVYGAKIDQLEKGANKVWGGMPIDGKVENLELQGDLSASRAYIDDIKQAMHEVGNMPEGALGAQQAISNTSGVALQITMLPLIDRVQVKQTQSAKCIQAINKFIIKIGLKEGLIQGDLEKWKKGDIYSKDIYSNTVLFEENLPKDKLVELQRLQIEMKMGLTSRPIAMKSLGRENIEKTIKEIDEDRLEHPELYGLVVNTETGELVTGRLNPEDQSEPNDTNTEDSGDDGAGRKKDMMKRKIGVNKEGTDAEVNSGLTNSPEKKDKEMTTKGKEKAK